MSWRWSTTGRARRRAPRSARLASLAWFTLLFNTHAHVALAFQRALAEQLAKDFRQLDARVRDALSRG